MFAKRNKKNMNTILLVAKKMPYKHYSTNFSILEWTPFKTSLEAFNPIKK